jgi:tripartite-type tricarboxylate transporter receptor subunit TctC
MSKEMISRKRQILNWTGILALCAILFVLSGVSNAAEKFPSKNMTIQIPFAGSGVANIIIRYLADLMEKDLGVGVVIDNKPGSGGAVGWALAMTYPPDGYHLVYASNSLIIQTYRTKGRIDYKHFIPLVQVNSTACSITVNKDSGWNTLSDFLKYAKANPGKVRVGNVGTGSLFHIFALSVEQLAGVKFTHVPFKGGGEAGASLLGKHIEAYAGAIADLTSVLPTGKLKVLAVADDERDPYYPEIPTFREAGYPFEMTQWRGINVPKGTDEGKMNILEQAFKKAASNPDYLAAMKKSKVPVQFLGRKEYTKRYFEAGETMTKILKEMETKK